MRSITGKQIKALTVGTAGTAGDQGFIAWIDIDGVKVFAQRTAAHELLLHTDGDGFKPGDFVAVFDTGAGETAPGVANPDSSKIKTVNAGGRYQTVTTGNPLGDASSKAVPAKIGLVSTGSELGDYASDVDETDDEVTLEPGTYIVHIHIGMYGNNTTAARLSTNQRMNTYHQARMTLGGVVTDIGHELSNTYIRPIGGTDGSYGGFTRSLIMRVPEQGAVSFWHASTGQSTDGYLGCRDIVIYRVIGAPVIERGEVEPDGLLDQRLQALEDKTADITFDPDAQQTWTPAANAIANGLYPFGRWRFVPHGDAAASYNGLDYSAAGWENDDGLTGAVTDAGIVWILPNNINWSRTRLVITRGDGTIKRTIVAQNLRNLPAARQSAVANFPAGPPDHTARWLAESDTSPHSIGDLEATDRVALQQLAETHTPIWEGELHTAQTERDERDILSLKALTADLTPGDVATGFADANADGTQGGIVMLDAVPSLADARSVAANRWAVSVSGVANIVDEYVLVRVPKDTHPAQARVFVTQSHNLDDFGDALNVMVHLGSSADDMWDYYADRRQWDAFTSSVTLQLTASADHVGTTVFGGEISNRVRQRLEEAETLLATLRGELTGERQLPAFPATTALRQGRVVKLDESGTVQWGLPVSEHEELASRHAIAGGWTIAGGSRLGGPGRVTQSGTTLRMNAQAALASDTHGVIIQITHTGGSTKAFIPWAMFRTGNGEYVSGGGHGTQGIPAGYWGANANSYVVARADWDFDNNRFELTLAAANATTGATLRVYTAR